MKKYNPQAIEPKWQEIWADTKLYAAVTGDTSRKKYYMLTEFPYPSGAGLHAGHIREYTIGDVLARHKRMQGYNVLFPMGYDAFGLPTENFAIKHKIRPQIATAQNVATFRGQFDGMGFSFDWDREVNTTHPDYYRWTQWLFLKFYEAGLAYQAEMAINWCPKEKTGLSNEEVVDGKHERCGTSVEKKLIKQWMLKITAYADRLIDGLKTVDYPSRIADQQVNWIGRSEGAEIKFFITDGTTSRPNYVILHGYTGRADKNWLPWLKQTLEKRGYSVETPELPHTDSPVEAEQVAHVLNTCTINENTVLIGHSLGGAVAMKVLEKLDHAIRQLILVAPVVEPAFRGPDYHTKKRAFVDTFDLSYDYKKVMQNAPGRIILSDNGEAATRKAYLEYLANQLQAPLLEADAHRNHFTGETEPFILNAASKSVTVYTTRPDTLFGATFLVVSPEMADGWRRAGWEAPADLATYVDHALRESELSRQEDAKVKTGVDTGLKAIHPLSGALIPVWAADYVLGGYGTGAIMAVPAHDERDFAFAKAFNLPIKPAIQAPKSKSKTALILHGTSGNNQKGWIPWLKSQLEAFGYEVIAPNLPDSDRPVLSAWLKALEPFADKMAADSIVIGHSLGAPTAQHFILENHLKIAKLMLVAPTFPTIDWDEYYIHDTDSNAKNIHDVSVVPIDWKALKQSVGSIVTYASQDDPYIPYGLLQKHVKANLPASQFRGFENKSHFNESAGITTLPEALGDLIDQMYTGYGKLINSGEFDGLGGDDAKRAIVEALEANGAGKNAVKYKLRDWIFSRQHYWGEPIPIIHCPKCGAVPVPEDQLPVTLPDVEHYEPTETGESPLAAITDWVNTTCPRCAGPAQRETDTMPNWAGSSWYYLRYQDAHNDQAFASPEALKYWGMADLYLGGMEHTTLHLLYSRFWHQFLYDQGLVPTPEPYAARRGQGIVLANDGRKMSKSIGNVVNPTDIIATHGADTLRLYILFMAPYDETTPWSEERLNGASRFVYKVWTLAQDLMAAHAFTRGMQPGRGDAFETEVDRATHKTIKKIHDDLHGLRFNTAVSALMEYVNFLSEPQTRARLLEPTSAALAWRALNTLVQLLAPITPHLSEELWRQLGWEGSVHVSGWPAYDPELIKDDIVTIVVQVNGKVRANLAMAVDATEAELAAAAQADPKVAKYINEGKIVKTIVVPRKLVNFVVK